MPTELEKLQAHASHLLDAFVALRQRYAVLEPLLFDAEVVQRYGSEKRASGFKILKNSLFLSCAQDIAKICMDKYPQTPSLLKLHDALMKPLVQDQLRATFTGAIVPLVNEEFDQATYEALELLNLEEKAARAVEFDVRLARVQTGWQALQMATALDGFMTVRDKISAHNEIRHVEGQYQPVEVGDLGIPWRDIRRVIDAMQGLVEDLTQLIRNAGFEWEPLDLQLRETSKDFWSIDPAH